ncbi:hypothetical protein WA026_023779 [Henosepilachna vigintioctopunctata]|uniref:Uncharacterized protein n=1 Tax=Henosepilachna vigintioctopunctata TaxID=420089 RepID=A0AAW1V4D1_9CUCU
MSIRSHGSGRKCRLFFVWKKCVPDTCDASVGYHPRPCYSNFNSIKSKYKQAVQSSEIHNDAMDVDDAFSRELNESSSKDDNEENDNTYSEVESSNVSSKSDNPIDKVQSCIICGKRYKRVNYRHLALSSTTNYDSFEQIKKYATKWNDVVLLNNIDLCETRECPIMYHGHCKASYNVNSKTKLKEKSSAWHVTRNH